LQLQNERQVRDLRQLSTARHRSTDEAARRRAAVELIRRHEAALRRTARRFSLCAEDAEDAYQRALEILLTKAPTDDPRQLIRWTQTVTKHEALAVRRNRERILGAPAPRTGDGAEEQDWVQMIPSSGDGPAALAERRERVARTREALQTLKPQELRALSLLAEGYSYSEIGKITGWSYTKVNRCLAEGRQRFRAVLSSSEDGRRCDELDPLLSAFCDGETDSAREIEVREHLRACAHCRSKLRAFRAAPQAAASLAPLLPVSRSLLERGQEALGALQSRLPGRSGGAEAALSHFAAAGGSRGAGTAVVAKLLAVCAGTAGARAACLAAGVVPAPIDPLGGREARPALERGAAIAEKVAPDAAPPAPPAAAVVVPPPTSAPAPEPDPAAAEQVPAEPSPVEREPAEPEFGLEPAPAPASSPPPPPPVSSGGGGSSSSGGGAASATRTEFGP
jgi:RNA polymerase sigma factor (sigma-70 family)